jgi:glutathione synthase/RimK-type ligase-like ATP-grasp enzyme
MKNSLKNIAKQFKQSIFFITNDPERAIGLETLLPSFHIVCIDKTSLTKQIMRQHTDIFCLEHHLEEKNPIFRNSNRLLKRQEVIEYITRNCPKQKTPYIQVFKIAPNIEKTAEKNDFKVLNPNASLNRMFENKLPQYKNLKHLEFFPQTKLITLKDESYSKLVKEFGEKFVLQYNRGHSGKSTIFIKEKQQYLKIQQKFPKRRVRISKFIKGQAWTVNACQTRYGCFYGGLSFQITGVSACTRKKGGTVGNDWTIAQNLDNQIKHQIHEMITKIGDEMSKKGFKGLFGLDLIIDNSQKVWLIEINARQPASISLHSQLQLKNQVIPLNLLHILEFVYPNKDYLMKFLLKSQSLSAESFLQKYNKEELTNIKAAQLFIRNTQKKQIKLRKEIPCGIYDMNLNRRCESYRIEDLQKKQNLIFSAGKGHIIKSNQEIVRIQTGGSIVNKKGKLYNKYVKLVEKIKSTTGLT